VPDQPLETSVDRVVVQFNAVTDLLETDGVEQTEVADLVIHYFVLHRQGQFGAVRFDATNEVQIAFAQQLLHQTAHLVAEFK
jgi:hypothetical protein